MEPRVAPWTERERSQHLEAARLRHQSGGYRPKVCDSRSKSTRRGLPICWLAPSSWDFNI
eukprot:5674401-Alexandrium_andersonii.AAC.2